MRLPIRAQRIVEDAVYIFWMGVGFTWAAVAITRFIIRPPRDGDGSTVS